MFRNTQRSWFFILLTLVVVGNLIFAAEYWLRLNVREAEREQVFDAVGTLQARLEVLVDQQIYILRAVGSHVAINPDISRASFSAYVENLLPEDTVVSIVALAPAPELVVNNIYPLAGNEAVLGLSYRTDRQSPAALAAIERNDVVVAGPIELVQGGMGFVARVPAFETRIDGQSQPKLWGLVAAVIRAEALYGEIDVLNQQLGLNIALRGKDATGAEGPVFFGDELLFLETSEAVTRVITVGSGSWQLAAVPMYGWGDYTSWQLWLLRGLGAFVFGLLAFIIFYKQRIYQQKELAQQNFADLFEHNNDGLFINDADTLEILNVNRKGESYLGYAKEELLGESLDKLYAECNADDLKTCVSAVADDGSTVFETFHQRKDGSLIPVEISAQLLSRESGDIVLSAVRDISDRREAQEALRKSQQNLVDAIESIKEGFVLWGPDGRLQIFNQQYIELEPRLRDLVKVGVTFEELLRHSYDNKIIVTDLDREEWIKMRMDDHKKPTGPYEFRVYDGRFIKISEYVTPDGSCVGIYEDITQLKRATEHIHYRAYFDVLTGLPNRENFLGKLSETLAIVKRTQQICGLLFIDLDRFKNINDTLGHAVGD
ncbi:MAG: PAS domain S-box protein, partial [Pseudomonadota bacterium]